ncbi:MAG: hypothetical protein KDA69_08285, partial [Planctomycetaceae bacterium]|nr:hypothetical protein [Planctomycetaceae bacterium]
AQWLLHEDLDTVEFVEGDFNGDGLADYVSVDLATSHAWVSRSAASAFLPAADFGLITGPEALVGPLNLWHSIVR